MKGQVPELKLNFSGGVISSSFMNSACFVEICEHWASQVWDHLQQK
jgi:hypothetical protein